MKIYTRYSLFLSALLVTTQLKGDKLPEWSEVPSFPSSSLISAVPQENRKILSTLKESKESARSISELLGDELWRNQDDIADALFRSIGDLSIDFDLIDNDERNVTLGFNPVRKLYFYNFPLTKENVGSSTVMTLDNSRPSHYVLYNSLVTKIDSDFKISNTVKVSNDSHISAKADLGLGIYYIQDAKSRRQLPPSVDEDVPINLTDEQKEELNAKTLKKRGFFEKLGKAAINIFNAVESGVDKVVNSVSDEERTEIFFDDLFDPLRLPSKLPLNNKTVAEKMKVNDIMTVSVFGGGGPKVTASSGMASISASNFVRLGYQVTVRKMPGNKVLVRPKVSLKKGWDFIPFQVRVQAGISFAKISYIPFFIRFEGANTYTMESLLEFDLNDPAAAEAFNDVITFSFRKTKDLVLNGNPHAKVSHQLFSKGNLDKQQLQFNIGLIKLIRDRYAEVHKDTRIDSEDKKTISWVGNARANSYSLLNLFKKRYEISKVTHTILKSNLDEIGFVLSDVKSNPRDFDDENLSRVNLTTLYDTVATRKDTERMLRYAELATGNPDLIPQRIRSQIDTYYKSKKSGRQLVFLLTKFNRDVMKTVLTLKPETFWRLLATTLLENPNQSLASFGGQELTWWQNEKHRELLSIHHNDIQWRSCKTKPAFSNASMSSCHHVWLLANYIGHAFEEVQKAKNDEERLTIFTKTETFIGISPVLNQILINGYKLVTGRAAQPEYYFRFSPAVGIDPYLDDRSKTLSKSIFKKDFALGDLSFITESEKRVKNGSVYLDSTQTQKGMILSFETPALLNNSHRVTLWLSDFRGGKKDIPIATSIALNMQPQNVSQFSDESLFRYDILLSDDVVNSFVEGTNELRLRIETLDGEPLSEFARYQIKKIQKTN